MNSRSTSARVRLVSVQYRSIVASSRSDTRISTRLVALCFFMLAVYGKKSYSVNVGFIPYIKRAVQCQ